MIVEGRTMRVVKVLIGKPSGFALDADAPNVITPVISVRVILENGAIFDRPFQAFALNESFVCKNFEEEEDKWHKYEPNTGQMGA